MRLGVESRRQKAPKLEPSQKLLLFDPSLRSFSLVTRGRIHIRSGQVSSVLDTSYRGPRR